MKNRVYFFSFYIFLIAAFSLIIHGCISTAKEPESTAFPTPSPLQVKVK